MTADFITAVLETVEDGIVACDALGVITLLNRAAREFHGLPEAHIPATRWAEYYDLYLPDGEMRMSREDIPLFRALQGEHVRDVEMVIAPKSGTTRSLLCSGQPLFGPAGEKLGAVVVMHDVTERKRAQEAAKYESGLMQALMDNIPDAIYFKDTDSRFTRVNQQVAYRTQSALANIVGKTDFDFFAAEHARAAFATEQQIIRTGQPIINQEEKETYLDGSFTWLSTTKVPIRDDAGQVTGIVGISRDITERKRAEDERLKLAREQAARVEAEAAKKSAAFLADVSSILGSSLDYQKTLQSVARFSVPAFADWCIVDILEGERRIHRVAVAAAEPAHEALLREVQQRYPPTWDSPQPSAVAIREQQSVLFTELSDATLAKTVFDAEHLRLIRALQPGSAIAVPLNARGFTLGAITFARVESERNFTPSDLSLAEELARRAALAVDNARLYEAAQEVNRLKDDFLATVSHELRTPLTPILGWAYILCADTPDADTLSRGLEAIKRCADAQRLIVDDLLDISRIITGKLRLSLKPVNLKAIIEAALDSARLAAEAKAIRIETVVAPDVSLLTGDPDRLQQVVWNLLSNAIKFTPTGGRVEVKVERLEASVGISVSDTGKGIDAKFLPYVFDRFRQADSSTTREHGGLGLGLAIVRHLVELHGGTVQAHSRGEGSGARFFVKLPSGANGAPRRSQAEASQLVENAPTLTGVRVLVVDDEADTREVLEVALSRGGAEVRKAASASEAFALLAQWQPDVLVSDIGMPVEDGYALMRRVRALSREHGGQVPAIALTAFARNEDREQALEAGYQLHLPKPVNLSELIAAVTSVLARD